MQPFSMLSQVICQMSAVERRKDSRLLMSTTTVKRLPPHVVSALANGLQVERENRITRF